MSAVPTLTAGVGQPARRIGDGSLPSDGCAERQSLAGSSAPAVSTEARP